MGFIESSFYRVSLWREGGEEGGGVKKEEKGDWPEPMPEAPPSAPEPDSHSESARRGFFLADGVCSDGVGVDGALALGVDVAVIELAPPPPAEEPAAAPEAAAEVAPEAF